MSDTKNKKFKIKHLQSLDNNRPAKLQFLFKSASVLSLKFSVWFPQTGVFAGIG